MQPATAIEEVLPGVFRWEHYSPGHKVELTSHAIVRDGRIFVFDPIPLAAGPMALLATKGSMAAIVLTNENHERNAVAWRNQFHIPIWSAAEALLPWTDVRRFQRSEPLWDGWELEWLDGGAGGEISLRWTQQSLVICGDAIVNLPGRSLELLPERYCRNQAQLKQCLGALVANPFERLVMAHGRSILTDASRHVCQLL